MKPLILDYAVNRKPDENIVFMYDHSLNLNTVRVNNKVFPFVEVDKNGLELTTFTRVAHEGNDVTHDILELRTKTEAKPERDDQDYYNFLELLTKTFVKRERDDE
jgi:hypothetical protein